MSGTATTSQSTSGRAPRRSSARRLAGPSASGAAPNGSSEGRLAAYRLTIRHGPKVERERFETLDDAVEALERRAEEVRREGPLQEVRVLRDFEPGQRVHARLELSTGGILRGREAGLDVMGDGTLVPYSGVVRKRKLESSGNRSAFDAVREALAG